MKRLSHVYVCVHYKIFLKIHIKNKSLHDKYIDGDIEHTSSQLHVCFWIV